MTPQQQEYARMLKDFRVFIFLVWRSLNLPKPTRMQNDIALYLQHGPKRSIIEAFRGVGKSWLTAAFVVWLLLRNPQLKIMVVSASKDRSDAFSTFVKRIINELPICEHLRTKPGQRDSMISFDVGPATPDQSPSVKSVGITGQLTGSRADIIIADDVEVLNNSATQAMRDKLSELVKEFDAILKPLDTSRIIYLGTPQCEMSLYNALPERGYEVRVWPAQYPTANKVANYKGRLAPIITHDMENGANAGDPTDPVRFTHEDLMERRVSYGAAGFAMQFMLDTTLSDTEKYPLKLKDLIVQSLALDRGPLKLAWAADKDLAHTDLEAMGLTGDRFYSPFWVDRENMKEWEGTVLAIDPSGRGSDETGYAVVSQLGGYLFLRASGGLRGGYTPENLETLANIAKNYKAKQVIIEANFGDGMYSELIKPVLGRIYPCSVEEVKHHTQKERRIIDTLEPVLSTHRLVVDKAVIEKDYKDTMVDPCYSLFYQMTRITADRGALKHDDRLDALAIAVAYWSESMARDNDKALEAHKAKMLDAELRKFKTQVVGAKKEAYGGWFKNNRRFK
jgi:hypothetical protein